MSLSEFLGPLAVVTLIVYFFYWLIRGESRAGGRSRAKDTSRLTGELSLLAKTIELQIDGFAHPDDLRADKDFKKAVAILANSALTSDQVLNYATGANWILTCAGCDALCRREDAEKCVGRVVSSLSNLGQWPIFFAVSFIEAKATEPVAARVVVSSQYWWENNAFICETIGTYCERRIEAGEEIHVGPLLGDREEGSGEALNQFIERFPKKARDEIKARLVKYSNSAVDTKFLRSVGETLGNDQITEPVFTTEQIDDFKEDLEAELTSATPRSILIVGESGVGKTSLRRAFARVLLAQGWMIFKTSAANIIAGKKYVGEIEEQVRSLANNATTAKRVAMFVDRMGELGEFGRYKGKDNSVLDQLWPEIESRKMFLVSETTPSGLQALARKHPSLPTVLKIMQMQAVNEDQAGDLAEQLFHHLCADVPAEKREEVVTESLQLAQQYLSHKAMPGSVLTLLELAVLRSQREETDAPNRDHVLGALSQISGLPKEVLDDTQQLDIDGVREAFASRVIGQDEAVSCLVERIAMLKAGLTDPGRPVGVFLFAGPTGTGKTEIAKRLAELLFGSPEQMIRLDMSEFQNQDSVRSILGQDEGGDAASLVSRIRQQPFSVVLLDEFEKAHMKIWDIFLQVFDDGRLTDARGQLADFRHAIIILTSNLGSTISKEAGMGFTSKGGEFAPADVMRTVSRTFRPEFVNRLDRVVVFNPLSREVMRAILKKELKLALGRRGLRSKQWAVEWEDSAIEFLLSEGFTADLGARPLRRAIERHLLAPLSITMVQNRAPAGEQFLFIRSDGNALQVEFVDPDDEPADGPSDDVAGTGDEKHPPSLAGLIMGSATSGNASDFLLTEMNKILDRTESESWEKRKAGHIAELNHESFWDREDRYQVLDRIELIDRLDTAATTLASLTARLQNSGSARLIKSTANRIHVVTEGIKDLDLERPTQAFLGIRLVSGDANLPGASEFLNNVIAMYDNWGKGRGMRLRTLLPARRSRYAALFTVSGFGSYGVLEPEAGVHVFEVPAGGKRFDRIRVRVHVAAVPAVSAEKLKDLPGEAVRNLDAPVTKETSIVRRYREDPSPLVRDGVRGWRTGRLEQVYQGNFDIIQ
jgi:ATP-dependent Clp protease ATP-binding subunit ClpC